MKNKDLLKIVAVIGISCFGVYYGISSYLSEHNKTNKFEVTEDAIINNLNSEDISNLVGDENIEKKIQIKRSLK